MNENPALLAAFPATPERCADDVEDGARPRLYPALFGRYRDLAKLRYDYPLVLVDGAADGGFVRSLSGIINAILQEIAPRGIEGERLRKHVLGLEAEIRTLVFGGHAGSLLALWDMAETNLLSRAGDEARESLSEDLSRARAILGLDGPIIDCGEDTAIKLFTHAWAAVQANKARRFHDEVDPLIQGLSDILKADALKSAEALGAEALKRSVGPAYEAVFDFEELSGILASALGDGVLPDKRRRRIRSVLSVLKSQRFFGPSNKNTRKGRRRRLHDFVFDDCASALNAFQKRLPEIVEILKAMSIARLEIDNRYRESRHDLFFRRFDERLIEPEDLALFPSYLVCLRSRADARAQKADLFEILSSGLPIKVLYQTDDILEELSVASGQFSFGLRSSQPAAMALGLNNAYVLQASSATLYRLRETVLNGLACGGPALFSVYSGVSGDSSVPAYLGAAAATESRAFPSFAYDPGAGRDWASRYSLDGNPQVEAEWPRHRLTYEDQDLQKISQDVAFTLVDFVACDRRYAGCFTRVPRSQWHDAMVPVDEFLKLDAGAAADKVPYVLVIDERNVIYRAVVESRLVDGARRCQAMWRSLQELAGIDNSHATRLLAREREIWQREKERELAELRRRPESPESDAAAPATPPAAEQPATTQEAAQEAAPAESAEPEKEPSGEPYIETPRCTTCNECIEINNRMFAYNENQQAYIADPDAGTYEQLVRAAENCQVCIIHPGKPRNPNEPGLDELIARAEPFN